jgi:rubrerythrin
MGLNMALQNIEKILEEFAQKEGKEHVDTYNKVALTAKAEGYADIEAMLCAYAEEEAKIAETARKVSELLKVKALLSDFAVKEGKEHVDTYNKVALTAKAEGYADIEAMLCAYAEEEAKIAETAQKAAAL